MNKYAPFDPAVDHDQHLLSAKVMTLDVYGAYGFALAWPYLPNDTMRFQCLNKVRMTAGFVFHKPNAQWISQGPEVLLDMDRCGLWDFIQTITPRAQQRIDEFRDGLIQILLAKHTAAPGQYGYQQAGSLTLTLQRRGLLADEMGLGKSKQALDACAALELHAILIISPKTLTFNWRDEVDKWYPAWPCDVLGDAKAERAQAFSRLVGDGVGPYVIIANYEKLRLGDWPFQLAWDAVIFDEIQRLKTKFTITHKAAAKVKAAYVWGLTGTPLEMRVEELYGIMSLIRPSVFGSFTRFREQHLITDAWGQVIGQKDPELLKERLGPWMTRRTKQEVLSQLPPKLYNTVYVQLSSQDKVQYGVMVRQFHTWLVDNDRSMSEANALTKLLRLQQFVCSPALLGNLPINAVKGRGDKYYALQEILAEWPGKAVVFTQFAQMAERLAVWVNTPYLITGNTGAEQRLGLVKRFNADRDVSRPLISTDAGAYGLNITGADLIVHYSGLWNPGKMWQREDRLHRIGQTQPVNVLNLIVEGTVDEGMLKVLERRRELFTDIVDGAEEVAMRRLGAGMLRKIAEGRT